MWKTILFIKLPGNNFEVDTDIFPGGFLLATDHLRAH